MVKKLQVFISSTNIDLHDERQAAVKAILDAGHIPAGMELFKDGKSIIHTIKQWIDNSDVYMLLLGGKYGSIEEESKLSYTHLEYEYALSRGMPIFSIVLSEQFLQSKVDAELDGETKYLETTNKDQYYKFRKEVTSRIVHFVNNIDNIISEIHSNLNCIAHDVEYHLTGWIKTDEAQFDYSTTNIEQLHNQHQNLIRELLHRQHFHG